MFALLEQPDRNVTLDASLPERTPHLGRLTAYPDEPGVLPGTKGCAIAEKIDRLDEIGLSLSIFPYQVYLRGVYVQPGAADVAEVVESGGDECHEAFPLRKRSFWGSARTL
jgi:hypothetical protein